MTTPVYYQKWRPSSFSELVGQEHVATTLRQSAKQGRISHSYLFCGPRGSGKTTSARILAKAANCLDLQDGDACNACTICQTINEGRFMDIIELDAASNRGIDEIREIREKVNFSPVQGGRKVYIIDEAHMLTDAASNAFLKTLEEPPAHVIFILCTTEAHKILPTIISRCQRFDFRRISSDLINTRLEEITRAEGVTVDRDALRLVARHAGGSLRDAENLLEQLAVSQADCINLTQVQELLGLGHGEREMELASHLLTSNTAQALAAINQAAWDGIDPKQLHRQTLQLLRAAMLVQWTEKDTAASLDASDLTEQTLSRIRELTAQLQRSHIIRALKLWGDANMRHDAPSTLPLEIAAVEICNHEDPPLGRPDNQGPPNMSTDTPRPRADIQSNTQANTQVNTKTKAKHHISQPGEPAPHNPAQPETPESTPPPAAYSPPPTKLNPTATLWATTIKELGNQKGKKYNFRSLLRDCQADAVTVDGHTLILPFAQQGLMDRMTEELQYKEGKDLVMEAVTRNFGNVNELKLLLWEKQSTSNTTDPKPLESPLVKLALAIGATIVE